MKGSEKLDPSNINFSERSEETLLEKATKEFFNEKHKRAYKAFISPYCDPYDRLLRNSYELLGNRIRSPRRP